MKCLVLFVCLFAFPNILFSQNLKQIRKEVKKAQVELVNSNLKYKGYAAAIYQVYIPLLNEARNMYNIWEDLGIISNNDTIFILDYPRIGEEYCDSYIWSTSLCCIKLHVAPVLKAKGNNWKLDRRATLSNGTNRNVEKDCGKCVDKYLMDGYTEINYKGLAEKWNIQAIHFVEKYGERYAQEQFVYLTRIIIKDAKVKCDCISFRDFQRIHNKYIDDLKNILSDS